MKRVTIVVPAKDEAEGIAETISRLPVKTLEAEGLKVDVVVVDGRSQDGTAKIARRLGARVLHDPGEGKGVALRSARNRIYGDYIVMLDADGSYAADAIPALLAPLLWGEADIVMGDRRPMPGSMTPVHRAGNAVLSLGASVLYGRACPDVCTGLWAFRSDAFHALPLESKGFELEAELFALSSRLGLRIAHAPVDYLPRAGTTKLSARRDGLRIGWCLIRSRFVPIQRPEAWDPKAQARRRRRIARPARAKAYLPRTARGR